MGLDQASRSQPILSHLQRGVKKLLFACEENSWAGDPEPEGMEDPQDAPPLLATRAIDERNLKRGLITRKEYERFLKSLSDAAANVLQDEPKPPPQG